MSDGILGGGNEIWLTNSSDVLTKLTGVESVNLPNPTVAVLDTTDQDSGAVMESQAGIVDPGPLSFIIKYIPGSADAALIEEHLASRAKRGFKIVKKGVTPNREQLGTIFITSFPKDTAGPTNLWKATVNAQVSGLPSEGDVA